MIPDVSKVIKDKLHINITNVKSNSHADMMSLSHTLDSKEIAYLQESVEDIYTKFTGIVSEGREMRVSYVDSIAQGRVWSGAEALEIGLVDQIGTLEDAINYAALSIEGVTGLEDVQVLEFPKKKSPLESLLEGLGNTDESVFAGTPFEGIERNLSYFKNAEAGKAYARIPYEISIK